MFYNVKEDLMGFCGSLKLKRLMLSTVVWLASSLQGESE